MMACSYAASFGMLQHFARIIPGTPGVRVLAHAAQEQRISALQALQEMGGLRAACSWRFSPCEF